jgi:hypothetical protein
MTNKKLALYGFFNAFGTVIYVSLVATIMSNGSSWFGQVDNKFLTPIAVLMLFVLSASIVGTLVLGRPALMFLDGKKTEGVKLFLYTLGWLFAFTIIAFIILASLPKPAAINLPTRS